MTNKDLLPCPFCGGKAKFYQDFGYFWVIQCTKCKIGTFRHKKEKHEAIDDWNRRIK